MVWPLGLKKHGLTDQGVATGVTKFHMASGGLKLPPQLEKIPIEIFKKLVRKVVS